MCAASTKTTGFKNKRNSFVSFFLTLSGLCAHWDCTGDDGGQGRVLREDSVGLVGRVFFFQSTKKGRGVGGCDGEGGDWSGQESSVPESSSS